MKVIIDIREKDLYEKCASILCNQQTASTISLLKESLDLGDILITTDDDKTILLIERKTFTDLLASIKDGRYEEQSFRLLNSEQYIPHSIIYVLEGMFANVRTNLEKKIIYSAQTSLQYFKGFSTHRTSSVSETAEWLLYISEKIERDLSKGKVPYYLTPQFQRIFKKQDIENQMVESETNYCTVVKKAKKENITVENMGEIILCQIPGISSTTAIAIMENYSDFASFYQDLQNNPELLKSIQYESKGKTRRLNKTCIENIEKFLLKKE